MRRGNLTSGKTQQDRSVLSSVRSVERPGTQIIQMKQMNAASLNSSVHLRELALHTHLQAAFPTGLNTTNQPTSEIDTGEATPRDSIARVILQEVCQNQVHYRTPLLPEGGELQML